MSESGATPLYQALLAVQAELPHLQKTAINPHFHSKYVPLEDLHEVVLPILHKHGLVWVTMPMLGGVGDTPQACLHYRLIHAESGHEIEGLMPLVLGKNDPQGQGSAITYARRYALMAVLGLVADNDDDGNAASTRPASTRPKGRRETRKAPKVDPLDDRATAEQRANIVELAKGLGWSARSEDFRAVVEGHAKSLKELTADDAAEIIMHLAKLTREHEEADHAAA